MAEPTLTLYDKVKKGRDFMLLWKHNCKILPFEKRSDEKRSITKSNQFRHCTWREILNTILVLVSVYSLYMKLFWIYKNAFNFGYFRLKIFFHFRFMDYLLRSKCLNFKVKCDAETEMRRQPIFCLCDNWMLE